MFCRKMPHVQTKTEATAMNVLEAYAKEDLSKDLTEATFVIVGVDVPTENQPK
jgi:hypothetical protein